MNDRLQNNDPLSRWEARRQRREALGIPGGSTWGVGVVLIVLGGIFLMQNTGIFKIPFINWWALFILIPAIGSLDRAYRAYKNAGNRLTTFARNSLFVGLLLSVITIAFLFNFNWSDFGPVLLILVGVGVLANSMLSGKQ